jgi:hypothetical protein
MVMPEQPATADTVQTEAARQAVILAFSIVGLLVMVWAQRAASDPDFGRTQKMAAAKTSERFLARLAARAWKLAERARLAYEDGTA